MGVRTLIKRSNIVLWLFPSLVFAQQPTNEIVRSVVSPDRSSAVAWFDSSDSSKNCFVRSIFIVDWNTKEMPLHFITFPRCTVAAWSKDSKRVAIIDGPDNANSFLWLGLHRDNNVWVFNKIDASGVLEAKIEKTAPNEFNDSHLFRGGAYGLEWENGHLEVKASADNKEFLIKIYPEKKNYRVDVVEVCPKEVGP